MFQQWFTILYWGLMLALGGGVGYSIHHMAHKMRNVAMRKVAEPWPSLKMELKQNNHIDAFVTVKKNGKTYILHRDRIKKP